MNKCLLILLVFFSPVAFAAPIVGDLSNYSIMMDSSFNGTRMFIFGARNEGGDVVVVVRGPLKKYIVRKKQEIGGIWVNKDRVKLFNIPDFYAIATSKPINEMQHDQLFKLLAIGHPALFTRPTEEKKLALHKEFTEAFIAHQLSRKLYFSEPATISFMGENLFKTTVQFPDNTPPGNYNAEIYLLDNNRIIGSHVIPIRVGKVGLDAFLYDYAHHSPFMYGITAVVLALSAGWFAGRLFERA